MTGGVVPFVTVISPRASKLIVIGNTKFVPVILTSLRLAKSTVKVSPGVSSLPF